MTTFIHSVEVPPIEPQCRVDDDCSDSLACIAQQCQNPCALYDNCASNAECYVTSHRPVCSCPDGFLGNPNVFCFIGEPKKLLVFFVMFICTH